MIHQQNYQYKQVMKMIIVINNNNKIIFQVLHQINIKYKVVNQVWILMVLKIYILINKDN